MCLFVCLFVCLRVCCCCCCFCCCCCCGESSPVALYCAQASGTAAGGKPGGSCACCIVCGACRVVISSCFGCVACGNGRVAVSFCTSCSLVMPIESPQVRICFCSSAVAGGLGPSASLPGLRPLRSEQRAARRRPRRGPNKACRETSKATHCKLVNRHFLRGSNRERQREICKHDLTD